MAYNAGVRDARRRDEERNALLQRIVDHLNLPMALLGFVWLVLLIFDLVLGLPPLLQRMTTLIWLIFLAEFIFEFSVAPRKLAYLRHNWLTALALFVPAARLFRVIGIVRAVPGVGLVRVVGSLNRGMHALGASLGRHGFRYVVALSLLVTFAGAAGMYAFERYAAQDRGLTSYADALWWTAMIMSTLGSGYWPLTMEGRILCLLLSLYAFSVFGYVTAALATFLVGREAQQSEGELPSAELITALHEEIAALREDVRTLVRRLPPDAPAPEPDGEA